MNNPGFRRLAEAIQRIYAVPDGDPFDAFGISAVTALFNASMGAMFAVPKSGDQGRLLAICNMTTLAACGLMRDISAETQTGNSGPCWPLDTAIAFNGVHPHENGASQEWLLQLLDLQSPELMLLGVIDETPDASYIVCLFRAAEDTPFNSMDCERLRSLLPHWRRALEIRRQLARLRVDAEGTKAILDQAPFAIMLAENDGRVIYSNRGASRLCGLDDGIGLAGSRLRLSRAKDRVALARALQGIVDPASPHFGEQYIFPVTRRSGKADFQLALMPISIGGNGPDHPAQQYIQIFIYDPAYREPVHGEALQSLHGLTAAETKVCELLYSNLSLAEIGNGLNISVNTVKTHLAGIFRKIGINSQRELMQYLAQAPKVGGQKLTIS